MPKLTQNVFPAYGLMFCNFVRVIKHIWLTLKDLGLHFAV